MAKEDVYIQQLKDLGVYDPAFKPVVHLLCIQERELSRAMKAWKATVPKNQPPSITDPLYPEIARLRRDMMTVRDSLGLTPKGLQRLRKNAAPPSSDAAPPAGTANRDFTALMNRIQEATNGKK